MADETTDVQVLTQLLAEEEIGGYLVKPWTVKQVIQVMPILDKLADELNRKNITFEGLDRLIEEQGVMVLKDLLQAALPQLPEFLAISLRRKAEEMEELELGEALHLGVKVLALNVDHLKNAFNLVMGEAGTLTR
jgi:hypothetical protein